MPSTAASSSSSLWPVLHLRHEADQPFIDLDLDSWLADRPCIDLVVVTTWLAAAQCETSEVEMGSKWRFDWRLTEWGWWFKKCGGRVLGFKVSLVIEEVWVVASRIWWFSSFELFGLVALGFDNFAGVWENEGFEIYDFVFELNFLGFCVYFSRKFLGLLVCLRGRTWSSCFGEEEMNFLTEKKKKEKQK